MSTQPFDLEDPIISKHKFDKQVTEEERAVFSYVLAMGKCTSKADQLMIDRADAKLFEGGQTKYPSEVRTLFLSMCPGRFSCDYNYDMERTVLDEKQTKLSSKNAKRRFDLQEFHSKRT